MQLARGLHSAGIGHPQQPGYNIHANLFVAGRGFNGSITDVTDIILLLSSLLIVLHDHACRRLLGVVYSRMLEPLLLRRYVPSSILIYCLSAMVSTAVIVTVTDTVTVTWLGLA